MLLRENQEVTTDKIGIAHKIRNIVFLAATFLFTLVLVRKLLERILEWMRSSNDECE